jgi:hypothetical protein
VNAAFYDSNSHQRGTERGEQMKSIREFMEVQCEMRRHQQPEKEIKILLSIIIQFAFGK